MADSVKSTGDSAANNPEMNTKEQESVPSIEEKGEVSNEQPKDIRPNVPGVPKTAFEDGFYRVRVPVNKY